MPLEALNQKASDTVRAKNKRLRFSLRDLPSNMCNILSLTFKLLAKMLMNEQ